MTLPDDATWDEFLAEHGGLQTSGWWIVLDWDTHSEVFGPYGSEETAEAALESSLINGICEDTKAEAILDDAGVVISPLSIEAALTEYDNHVTLIDPTDPDHFGGNND